MRWRNLSVLLLATALGCFEFPMSGSSEEELYAGAEESLADLDAQLRDLDKQIEAWDDLMADVEETLCILNVCSERCLPHPRQMLEVPALCSVTCADYPCQPVCEDSPERAALDEFWCREVPSSKAADEGVE